MLCTYLHLDKICVPSIVNQSSSLYFFPPIDCIIILHSILGVCNSFLWWLKYFSFNCSLIKQSCSQRKMPIREKVRLVYFFVYGSKFSEHYEMPIKGKMSILFLLVFTFVL